MDIELIHILCAVAGIILTSVGWIAMMISFDKDKNKAGNTFILVTFIGIALFIYGTGAYCYSTYGPLEFKEWA